MNADNYNIHDLLMDESFFYWAKNPHGKEGMFWKPWLIEHPEKQQEVEIARKLIQSMSFKDKSFNKIEITQLWEAIKAETIDLQQLENYPKRKGKFLRISRTIKIAAVILPFLIAAAVFIYSFEGSSEEVKVVQQTIEKLNPRGQKLTVFLSDGSKIKLNADSKISYPKPFDATQRTVTLEGEAYFDIAPDSSKPFIVKTGNIETRVVGTSFNIKAYPTEGSIKVAVKSGQVMVTNSEPKEPNASNVPISLSQSEMLTFTPSTNSSKITSFNEKEVMAWSEGVLYFNNASIQEFVAEMERWYGVEIIIQRKAQIKTGIVGEFKDQTLEEILMGTKDASEFEYEFADGKVIIK